MKYLEIKFKMYMLNGKCLIIQIILYLNILECIESITSIYLKIKGIAYKIGELLNGKKNIEIENKGSNLTVHFRNSTIDRKEINKIMLEIVKYEPKLILLEGKEVLEVKPLSHNKGTAISYYMKTKPFIKRRPIFIGDDISDEDGFETVNKIGGWSVRVGNYKRSKANFFLPNVKSVHEIMEQLLKSR